MRFGWKGEISLFCSFVLTLTQGSNLHVVTNLPFPSPLNPEHICRPINEDFGINTSRLEN